MADTTSAEIETAMQGVIAGGQSVSVDGVSVTKASVKDLDEISQRRKEQEARASGARPLFRCVNLSSMGYS